MVVADGVTDATLVLAVVTLFVAYATWRLGTRASEETRAQWRPVILVRARSNEMDVKLRLAVEHLTVDLENTGRGPALDVFTEGLKGLERRDARVSALATGERWTCSFTKAEEPDPFIFRVSYSDISGSSFSTTVMLALNDGEINLVTQMVEAHPSIGPSWIRLIPHDRLRRWTTKKVARWRGYRI